MSWPRAMSRWFLLLLASCATSADRPPATSRPLCAQPFTEGRCLEGTWPATWRDGRWDCKLLQDQLALEGIPADRCASFVGPEEVAELMRAMNAGRGAVRGP